MLLKNQAIVLSSIKYSDSDLIVKCFTLERGVTSYLLKSILKSSKGKLKAAYFQPLTQLFIEEYYRPKSTLQGIKEVKLASHYLSLHSDVVKSSIALFLSEVLASVLKEEGPQEELFSFLETALQVLDHEDKVTNFHLLFLIKLTKYLGIYPYQTDKKEPYFNLQEASFESTPTSLNSVEGKNVALLKRLMEINFDSLQDIKLNSIERQSFLNMILTYYELHLLGFKKPKSLEVLNKLFA